MNAKEALAGWKAQTTTLKPVNIVPLLATTVGSICRGYGSPFSSDRDLRVVYVSPVQDYLTVFKDERVVKSWKSADGEWDVSGWDLHRFLRLMWSGDPNAYEVLDSHVLEDASMDFRDDLRALSREVLNKAGLFHGHRGQAHNMGHAYRHRGMAEFTKTGVSPAKYVLHRAYSLMAAMHIVQVGTVPPLNIQELARSMIHLCSLDCTDVEDLANRRYGGRPINQRNVQAVFLKTERLDELVTHSLPYIDRHALTDNQKLRNGEKVEAFLRDVLLRRKYGTEESTHA